MLYWGRWIRGHKTEQYKGCKCQLPPIPGEKVGFLGEAASELRAGGGKGIRPEKGDRKEESSGKRPGCNLALSRNSKRAGGGRSKAV
jgi:hypothetical protein